MALCYKDRTFCASDCTVSDCYRYFGPAQREGARAWWSHDPDNAPISWTDFSGRCSDYTPPDRSANSFIAARETKEGEG
jgi:hypothetical protein